MNKVNWVHKISCRLIYLFFKCIDVDLLMFTHFTMCRHLFYTIKISVRGQIFFKNFELKKDVLFKSMHP